MGSERTRYERYLSLPRLVCYYSVVKVVGRYTRASGEQIKADENLHCIVDHGIGKLFHDI